MSLKFVIVCCLLEADWSHLEPEGLARLPVITGEEVDDGKLPELGGPHLEDGLGLLVRLFRLEYRIIKVLIK